MDNYDEDEDNENVVHDHENKMRIMTMRIMEMRIMTMRIMEMRKISISKNFKSTHTLGQQHL